jgi:transketolase N-terminal domain/subunit
MSWRYLVVINDDSLNWLSNDLRYDTKNEAIKGAEDFAAQWRAVTAWRVLEINEEDE